MNAALIATSDISTVLIVATRVANVCIDIALILHGLILMEM